MIKHFMLSLTIIAGAILGLSGTSANAAPLTNISPSFSEPFVSNLLKVHYPRRRSCKYWRDRCGYYHSYNDYEWCLRDRGCSRYSPAPRRRYRAPRRNRCRSRHFQCVRRWGRDNSNYFGCMRYHRCLLRNNYSRY